MRARSLGPGAPDVSVIGLGGMHLSTTGRPPDEATALRVIHAALDSGVTLLDTADVYCLDDGELGHNERLMAKALRTWGGRREAVIAIPSARTVEHAVDSTMAADLELLKPELAAIDAAEFSRS